ncbi:hypothetical protein [Nonomuraea maritima]|uniref:hypothetical protein n=1 Tax=Nonomuraea maritima TaxID=683260 RepID=UPI0037108141
MSSYSGWAAVDLADGREAGAFVAALHAAGGESPGLRVAVEGRRVFVYAGLAPHLTATIAHVLPEWGSRAVTAADFDEFGVVNEVLGPDGKPVHVASIGEEMPLPEDDTPHSRRAAAELFGADPAALDHVSATWAADGAMPSAPGVPYLKWWDALGVPWPADFDERSFGPEQHTGA